MSTPFGGSYTNASPIKHSGSKGCHVRQSRNEKLGVKSGLVKKQKGESTSLRRSKPCGKLKGKRDKKHQAQANMLIGKDLIPENYEAADEELGLGVENNEEAEVTFRMSQNLGIEFDAPESVILENFSKFDACEKK
ncbi:hypothetical protein V6N11_022288 [Hibiscus sabdariffa]|uniref:Uncharacterized protein n=1 Tax=Hibiscus sabdariffa TaxID=183260 RepID=A0ABR2TIR6_9ROSI